MRSSFALPLLLCACGLTARGSAALDGGEADTETVDAGTSLDAASDAAIDVEAGPDCTAVVVEDMFSTAQFDPAKWIATRNTANVDSPKPYFTDRPLLSMLDATALNARGGLWYTAPVPFTGFEVDLDVDMVCSGSCGDGLAVNFLDTATAAQLDDAQTGDTLGVPSKLSGAAVSVDLAKNAAIGDGDSPAVQILDVDATKVPGQYPWTVAVSPQMSTIKNTSHRLSLSGRNQQLTVKVDGAVVVQGAMAKLPTEGTFGFSAASGGYTAGITIADVRAKFYRCNAP
jgi:hypothetical protein